MNDKQLAETIRWEVNQYVVRACEPGASWCFVQYLTERLGGMRTIALYAFGKDSESLSLITNALSQIDASTSESEGNTSV